MVWNPYFVRIPLLRLRGMGKRAAASEIRAQSGGCAVRAWQTNYKFGSKM